MDLTIGDHLEHLAADPEIRVFGVYVEGFAPLDGRRFVAAARAIADRGGVVVLYRAGRTTAGASASASHTAAIAGDALGHGAARAAGRRHRRRIGLEAFDDLVRTLRPPRSAGRSPGGASARSRTRASSASRSPTTWRAGPRSRPGSAHATERRLAAILGEAGLGRGHRRPQPVRPHARWATTRRSQPSPRRSSTTTGVDVGRRGRRAVHGGPPTLPAGAAGGEDLAAPGRDRDAPRRPLAADRRRRG